MLEKMRVGNKGNGDVIRDQYIYQLETDLKVKQLNLQDYLHTTK